MEHFAEDLFSFWSINECSPSWSGPRNPVEAYQYSNPIHLSQNVQPLLWTKMLSEAPNGAPKTVCSSGNIVYFWISWITAKQHVWPKTFDKCLCNIALSLHSPVLCSLWQFIFQSVIKLIKFKISVLILRGTSDLCPGYLIGQLKATNENQRQQFSSLLEQSILQLHKISLI